MMSTSPEIASDSWTISGIWFWQKTILNDGTIINPRDVRDFSLNIKEDNSVNGQTDCNNFSTTCKINNTDNITFSPIASTMMYCDNSQENFTDFISQSKRYQINNINELVLFFRR